MLAADADPFSFGLERLLDGVEAYIGSRGESAAPRVPAAAPVADQTDAFPKDPKVRAARVARRAAEKSLREAERKLGEAVKREREAVARARERTVQGSD